MIVITSSAIVAAGSILEDMNVAKELGLEYKPYPTIKSEPIKEDDSFSLLAMLTTLGMLISR